MNDPGRRMASEKILFFPFDLMSHYLRCIELARRYPHAEIFFASSEKYDHFVHKAGYKTVDAEHFDAAFVMDCAAKFDFSWLNTADIERVFLSQVKSIHDLRPHLVIGDTSPALKMAAEYSNVPYTALMNGYMCRYYAHVRTLSQAHPGHVYLSRLPPGISRRIVQFAEKISFRLVHKPFRQLRRKYHLRSVSDYIHEMEGDENLLCDDEFLFPQKKLPGNYKIIGPLMYETGQSDEALLNKIPPGKKAILVCMGSSGSWKSLSFLASPHYSDFIIITAGDADQTIKGDHVIAMPFVSLKNILPKCSLLICHGGNGTIYHGIKHKLPMLCLTSHFEQEWNVQRLEDLGLGTRINANPKAMVDQYLYG